MSESVDIEALVERAAQGDHAAFGTLVARYQPMAYAYACGLLGNAWLAEDATQEAFVAAFCHLGELRQTGAFGVWLRRIVYKQCDRITRRREAGTMSLDGIVESAAPGATVEERVAWRASLDQLLVGIRGLPVHQRTTMLLYCVDGLSQAEVAAFLRVPVTTVKKRIHDARKKLGKGMITVMKNAVRSIPLPEGLAHRITRYPFPRWEPSVEVTLLDDDALCIRCSDMQAYFAPLAPNARCHWTFYDQPGGRLTGVYEYHVVGAARWAEGTLYRCWIRYNALDGTAEWDEKHVLVVDDTWRWVQLDEDTEGKVTVVEHPRPGAADDPPFEPVPMALRVGLRWGGFAGGEVAGAASVTIGDRRWRCLRVVTTAQRGTVFAEWFVAECGRTILFRRYNGPGYREPGAPTSFESLVGCAEVVHDGIPYRHAYDCIPDIALMA